jgi:hypothetical protein
MAELFDDISRIVGSHLPRRRMLKLIAGVFAGGALPAALWPTRSAAFVMCGLQFTAGGHSSFPLAGCKNAPGSTQQTAGNSCCDAALNNALASAQQQCVTTCPRAALVAGTWDCTSSCSTTDVDSVTCAGNGTFYCYCDAGPNLSCCGLNNYCNKPAQNCCGTTCVAAGTQCPTNPTNPR